MTKPTPHKSPSTNWATGKVATERRMRKYFLGEPLFFAALTRVGRRPDHRQP
jgi:hypothetical protein